MKSRRHHHPSKPSLWAHANTPDALRRRRAKADVRREVLSATLPPVYTGPEPLSLWQTVQVLDGAGRVLHSIDLYVPTAGRCDQHAATINGARCDRMLAATDVGRLVAGMVLKRPSVSLLAEWRSDFNPCTTNDELDAP